MNTEYSTKSSNFRKLQNALIKESNDILKESIMVKMLKSIYMETTITDVKKFIQIEEITVLTEM